MGGLSDSDVQELLARLADQDLLHLLDLGQQVIVLLLEVGHLGLLHLLHLLVAAVLDDPASLLVAGDHGCRLALLGYTDEEDIDDDYNDICGLRTAEELRALDGLGDLRGGVDEEAALLEQPLPSLRHGGADQLPEVGGMQRLSNLGNHNQSEEHRCRTYLAEPLAAPLLADQLLLLGLEVQFAAPLLEEGEDVCGAEVLDAGDAAHVDVLGEDGLAAAVPDLGHPIHVAVGSVGQVIADLDGEEVEALLGGPEDLLHPGLGDDDVAAVLGHVCRQEEVNKNKEEDGNVSYMFVSIQILNVVIIGGNCNLNPRITYRLLQIIKLAIVIIKEKCYHNDAQEDHDEEGVYEEEALID